jgi:hypothetical protein
VLLHCLIQQLDTKFQRRQLQRLRSSGYRVSLALVLCPGFTVRFHVFFTAAVFVTTAVAVALSSGDLLLRSRYQSLERVFLTIVESV